MAFGDRFRVRIFGRSHGPEVGAEIEGIPKGRPVSVERIQSELDRRTPVGRRLSTKRQEPDHLVIDSGLRRGVADGTLFRAHVANIDVRREPYEALRDTPRPGHADFPARIRFGSKADLSGGGIFSGRMTVGLVIAGAVARQLMEPLGVRITAFTRAIGGVEVRVSDDASLSELAKAAASNEVGCPSRPTAARMRRAIEEARRSGDSVGGIIECRAGGLPVGLGEPFFDSLESTIAHLAFSIPAVKGVEFGAGFRSAEMKGSAHNDPFKFVGNRVTTTRNSAGGILGGMATGATLVVRLAVKPTSSIPRPQSTVNLATHENVRIVVTGRHDPCIVPRAVVVAEAVVAIGLVDLALRGGYLR